MTRSRAEALPARAPRQQLLFWRNREAAFFSFLFPIILLVLLGSVYGDEHDRGRGAPPTFLLVGLIGYGVAPPPSPASPSRSSSGASQGVLKRVRGTPLGPATYLGAVIGSEVVVIALQVIAQLLIGATSSTPPGPTAPGSFAFAVLLGAAAFAALGLAVTTLVRTADGSSAVVNAIYLPMAFISGVFFSTEEMPAFLEAISRGAPADLLARPHPRDASSRARTSPHRGPPRRRASSGASPGSWSPCGGSAGSRARASRSPELPQVVIRCQRVHNSRRRAGPHAGVKNAFEAGGFVVRVSR